MSFSVFEAVTIITSLSFTLGPQTLARSEGDAECTSPQMALASYLPFTWGPLHQCRT